jgi:hypothetical protein
MRRSSRRHSGRGTEKAPIGAGLVLALRARLGGGGGAGASREGVRVLLASAASFNPVVGPGDTWAALASASPLAPGVKLDPASSRCDRRRFKHTPPV